MKRTASLVAALAAVAGCAVSPVAAPIQSPRSAVTQAPPATTSPPPPAPSSSTPSPTPVRTVAPEAVIARLTRGIATFRTARITVRGETGATPLQATGAIDQTDPAKPKVRVTTVVAGQSLDLRIIDGVTYLQVPGSSGKYLKATKGTGTALTATQLAPAAQVKSWTSLSSVQHVGPVVENGISSDRYSADAVVQGTPVKLDVWIGDQDRPIRTKVVSASGTVIVDYSDFNAPVTITAPAPSQIATR
jgi:hypothetical protein